MRELSLHILDIVQNSLSAGASQITLRIKEDHGADLLKIEIGDNGRGMDESFAKKVLDPFVTTRTTRRVGLGLPLFHAAALHCNGQFDITSEVGIGTVVIASFQHSHIDRAPLGNLVGTLIALITCNPEIDFEFEHYIDGDCVELDTSSMRQELGDVPVNHPEVIGWVKEYLQKQYQRVGGVS